MSAHTADYFLQVPVLTLRDMITKLTITCKPQNKTPHSTKQGNLPTFLLYTPFSFCSQTESRVTPNCLLNVLPSDR